MNKAHMYPMIISTKGRTAIEYVGAYPIFAKHCNLLYGSILTETGYQITKEDIPSFTASRTEIMWAM